MSLTVDLRLPGGGKAATVTGSGQVINLEVWATARGSNSSASDESLQIAVGSLLSSNVNGGAANGTLKVSPLYPFNTLGSQSGASRDLDGDGDLDVGSNTATDGSAFFAARSGGPTTSGTASGSSKAFKIGTATFTVTALKSTTGQTNLVFRTRNSGGTGALWWEDGNQKRETSGTYTAGSPVVLKRSGGTNPTPTGSATISGVLYSDADKDGQLDSGDSRLSSRKMFIDANKNGTLDSGEKSTYTNSSGTYTFSNLGSGTYRIRRADMPKGYAFSSPSSGYHDVTVSGTQQVTGKHFGVVPSTTTTNPTPTGSASISGVLFNDGDRDGQLDSSDSRLSSRKMYIDANKNGVLDSGERSTYTTSSGTYTFGKLGSGTYRIRRADTPKGYTFSTPSGGYHDVTVSGTQQVTGKHFGMILGGTTTPTNPTPTNPTPTGSGTISGIVFDDLDKDGQLDSTDKRLGYRKMYIDANKNGQLDSGEKTATTNSSGVYTFSSLGSATYRIRRADVSSGYVATVPSSGYYDILLGTNATVTGRHFGYKPR